MKKQFENFLKTKTFLILYLIQPVSSRKREATEGEWGGGGGWVGVGGGIDKKSWFSVTRE